MKNIIFDMETGDPDDLITLCLLLINPEVELRAVTCYEGSPIQIGLIRHILALADKDIPVGSINSPNPQELNPYYTDVLGQWKKSTALATPLEVFKEVSSLDCEVLTGAPLTNIAAVLEHLEIPRMTTQGGYIGSLATHPLKKFKGRKEIRTYNLSNDREAFERIFHSSSKITYVTKDLCHGFMYTPEIHASIDFGEHPIQQTLKKCLEHYALAGKSKAMHDPLAMLYMLYPEIGRTKEIYMSYRISQQGHALFSSIEQNGSNRFALVDYDSHKAWDYFRKYLG